MSKLNKTLFITEHRSSISGDFCLLGEEKLSNKTPNCGAGAGSWHATSTIVWPTDLKCHTSNHVSMFGWQLCIRTHWIIDVANLELGTLCSTVFYCKHTADHLNVLYLQTCIHVSDVCRAGQGGSGVQWSEVIRLGPAAGVMDSSTDTQDQDTSHRQALGRGQGSSSIVYSAGAVTRGRNRTVTTINKYDDSIQQFELGFYEVPDCSHWRQFDKTADECI